MLWQDSDALQGEQHLRPLDRPSPFEFVVNASERAEGDFVLTQVVVPAANRRSEHEGREPFVEAEDLSVVVTATSAERRSADLAGGL